MLEIARIYGVPIYVGPAEPEKQKLIKNSVRDWLRLEGIRLPETGGSR
jgi:hypothetical protein